MADENTTPNSEQPQNQQSTSTSQSQQSSQGSVPPTDQNTSQQQPYTTVPPQTGSTPQNLPGMPLLHLTSGMKLGWGVVGFCMGLIGILIAWLTNAHNFPKARSEAVKFSLIGFLISVVLAIILLVLVGFTACTAMRGAYYYF